jgi:hypothetical protein
METAQLIAELEAGATPVRRLPPPWARAARWLMIAVPAVAAVIVLMTPRPDLGARLGEVRFAVELAAALATAILAAFAAFALTVPGHSRTIALLPLLPLAVWLGSVGQSCVGEWAALGPAALDVRVDWDCLRAAFPVGAAPAAAMVLMLRRGAPLFPRISFALGALAVGALANAGLQIYHEGDISIMVLVWHFGSVAVLAAIAALLGRLALPWPSAFRKT